MHCSVYCSPAAGLQYPALRWVRPPPRGSLLLLREGGRIKRGGGERQQKKPPPLLLHAHPLRPGRGDPGRAVSAGGDKLGGCCADGTGSGLPPGCSTNFSGEPLVPRDRERRGWGVASPSTLAVLVVCSRPGERRASLPCRGLGAAGCAVACWRARAAVARVVSAEFAGFRSFPLFTCLCATSLLVGEGGCRGVAVSSPYPSTRHRGPVPVPPLSACAGGARTPPEAFGAAAGSPRGMRAGLGTAPSSPVPPCSGGSGGSCGLAAAVLSPPNPPGLGFAPGAGGPAGHPRLAARLWEGAQGWPGRVPFTGCPLGGSEVSWQEPGARRGLPRAAPSPPRAEGRQGSGLGGLRGH